MSFYFSFSFPGRRMWLVLLVSWMGSALSLAQTPDVVDDGNAECLDGTYAVLNPGSSATIHTSEHFAIRWNPTDGVVLTDAEIQFGLAVLEDLWRVYVEEIGFQEPYCRYPVKYKVNVNVSNQGWATGAGTGDHDPAMWVHYNAFNDPGVLAHEFTHTLQFTSRGMRDSDYVGWFWESHAEWMRFQFPAFRDQVGCAEMLVNFPHLYYGSTRDRYCNWQFWEFIKDRYGYKAMNDMWRNAKEPEESGYRQEDPFSVLARTMGWSVSQLNDEFGLWALHNATWDYTNPDGSDQGAVYRAGFGSYSDRSIDRYLRVTRLDTLDLVQRRFVVPEYWAPQRWGYNLVRLYPDNPGRDATVKVTFRGVVQDRAANTSFDPRLSLQPTAIPEPASDWRWGLVALGASGERRYSPLQRGADAELTFEIKADDQEVWMAVVGTPKKIHQIMWDQVYYTIYRFPWMVQFEGVLPEGFQAGRPNPSSLGHWHANGGGWVASGATVASSAYVGPNAAVLGGNVKDKARIEDHAVVWGGIIQDSAVVGALSIVRGGITIGGGARAETVFQGPGAFGTRQSLTGTCQVLGDLELQGDRLSLSSGVYYGYQTADMVKDIRYGFGRQTPPVEVTAQGPFTWRDEPVGTEADDEVPETFRLDQNFPNPFNPSTIIPFEIPASGHVHLSVYDVTGRRMAVLVDGVRAAGRHEVRFDATGLPGGLYFYELETGGFRAARGLVLVK